MLDRPLSKSALQMGAQCPRMLWLKYNNVYESDSNRMEDFEAEQLRIGDIVGEAAQSYFGEEGLVVINTDRGFAPRYYQEYADETADAMADPDVESIAEAAFYTGDLIVFVDILHRNPDGGWDIYEVKATNRIGPVHVRDASWQTYVARELCGVDIQETYLMHPYRGWEAIASKSATDPDDFEIVDDYSNFIYNYSTGGTSPEDGWLNGMTIEEAIDYLADMVTWELPPECEGEPGQCICCTAPYRCNWIQACREQIEDERRAEEETRREEEDYDRDDDDYY